MALGGALGEAPVAKAFILEEYILYSPATTAVPRSTALGDVLIYHATI